MKAEIKRIARKARRYATRNKQGKPARFARFDDKNRGHFLHLNLAEVR